MANPALLALVAVARGKHRGGVGVERPPGGRGVGGAPRGRQEGRELSPLASILGHSWQGRLWS